METRNITRSSKTEAQKKVSQNNSNINQLSNNARTVVGVKESTNFKR